MAQNEVLKSETTVSRVIMIKFFLKIDVITVR